MSDFQDKTAEIMRQAKQAVEAAQRRLDAYDELLRKNGLDREKVCALLQTKMTPEQRTKSEALVRADLAEVEREVAAEMRRRKFAVTGRAAPAKRQRAMV